MPNLPAARSELDRIEAFLRSRYHYPHPIFEHVATVREHLEGDLPTEAAEAPQETATEDVAARHEVAAGGGEAATQTEAAPEEESEPEAEESPALPRRKRGKR